MVVVLHWSPQIQSINYYEGHISVVCNIMGCRQLASGDSPQFRTDKIFRTDPAHDYLRKQNSVLMKSSSVKLHTSYKLCFIVRNHCSRTISHPNLEYEGQT